MTRFARWCSPDMTRMFTTVAEFGGWNEADWGTGLIQGHAVEVYWPDVVKALVAALPALTTLAATAPPPAELAKLPARRGPARIDHRERDGPLVAEMSVMIANGRARNPTDAARELVGRGVVDGIGSDDSKVTRLVRHYHART